MKFTIPLNILLLTGSFAYASSLTVYQDNAFYTFTPKTHFIGFNQRVKAKCEGRYLPLSVSTTCPSDDRLCRMLTEWKNTNEQAEAVEANGKILNTLISLPQPTAVDANAWIASAQRLGEEQARLSSKERALREEAKILQKMFQRQAPSIYAVQTTQACDKEVELTIPDGSLSFSTYYEADIEDEKEATVTQYLSVTNRSGIDIQAETATFFYRSSHQYLHPIHFRPWIVSRYEPRGQYLSKSAKPKRGKMEMALMAQEDVMAPSVSYEDARKYRIEDLLLSSTGLPVDLKVVSWNTALSCDLRAYPYENRRAFHVCSFDPKYQIDSNEWKVRSSGVLVNDNAVGEYRKENYELYTKVEEDIQIERKRIVNKERETGIFGGTLRKKDGFTLTVINKSDKSKKLTLIERIPTSTTEEIDAKLLKIHSEKKINYKMLKDGKIEMKFTLAAHEKKKIDVLFEISHDKDLKVKY